MSTIIHKLHRAPAAPEPEGFAQWWAQWPSRTIAAGRRAHYAEAFDARTEEIERLRAKLLEMEAVHEDASGKILEALDAERAIWKQRCRSVYDHLHAECYDAAESMLLTMVGPNGRVEAGPTAPQELAR